MSHFSPQQQEQFMNQALKEAHTATLLDEVPVGCVLVDKNGEIIANTHNKIETEGDPTCHAEMLAIKEALQKRDSRYLDDCELFVTLEPCAMCSGALQKVRIGHVHFAAHDKKGGFLGSVENIATDPRLNYRFGVTTGVKEKEAVELLQDFFEKKR